MMVGLLSRGVRRTGRPLAGAASRLAVRSRPATESRVARILLALLVPAIIPAALAAQDTQILASLRGETGVDPAPGTLLATPSRFSTDHALLVDALVQLAERSQVQIAFSPSLLPSRLRVDCDCATLSVARVLDRLLADTDLGYVELASQVVVVPRVSKEIAPEAVLRGRVRSEVAVPIEDATVRLLPAGDPAPQLVTGTDRLGFFIFDGLVAGDYILTSPGSAMAGTSPKSRWPPTPTSAWR